MHIMIIGAAGMIGRKLTQYLATFGHLGGKELSALSLVDLIEPERPAGLSANVSVAVRQPVAWQSGQI
jgi:nucleoside-diphosphate-sugar epimerase